MTVDIFYGILPVWRKIGGSKTLFYYLLITMCHVCLARFFIALVFLGIKICVLQDRTTFTGVQYYFQWLFGHLDGIVACLMLLWALGCGVSAYNFREKITNIYGWVEIVIGMETVALGFAAFSSSPNDRADAAGLSVVLASIGGIYVVVRGCDNVNKAFQKKVAVRQNDLEKDKLAYLSNLENSANSAANAAIAAAESVKISAESMRKIMQNNALKSHF